jgi:predicted HicB family RNase H-like nuclease
VGTTVRCGATAPPETEESKRKKRRRKATGEIVHVTLRLNHEQWNKAHQFARSEGVSLNQLAIDGINMLLKDRGLPELDGE